MIAITGANGFLGRDVLAFLLRKKPPSEILALARNPATLADFQSSGVLVRKADYDDPDSLRAAFEGVFTVLQISAGAVGNPFARSQEDKVVQAMSQSDVRHVFYTSAVHAHAGAIFSAIRTQFQTEQSILRTGIPFTFFRNGKYMESLPYIIGPALRTGEIVYPADDAIVSFVSRRDIAEALANALTGKGHERKTYEITGEKACSFPELAEILSFHTKRLIRYRNCAPAEFRAGLLRNGLPAPVAADLAEMAEAIRAGEFSHVDPALEQLLERKRKTIREYMAEMEWED
jgi:NAD(P)H dehydrogenase (quinone)